MSITPRVGAQNNESVNGELVHCFGGTHVA